MLCEIIVAWLDSSRLALVLGSYAENITSQHTGGCISVIYTVKHSID